MTARATTCRHQRGDWISEQAYWLCADCWAKLPSRPRRYGPTSRTSNEGARQDIIWEAEIAKADGVTLNDFLRTMARRYERRTRPQIDRAAAYSAAIEYISALGDDYGDPAYCWNHDAAREFADDDMQDWDRNGGN